MKIFKTIQEIRAYVHNHRTKGNSIGFVPTMGALHQGHLDLVDASNDQCEITVVSIFVNPTQFNNPDDLEKYPRTVARDQKALEDHNCDALFMPNIDEVYDNSLIVKIDLGGITTELEGKFRPDHFNGVALVVSKLFNIVQPDYSFFGQKDIQQFYVIKKLRDSLNFPIKLEMVPTRREVSGLAMSSRNMRLNHDDRTEASLLYRSLMEAKQLILAGESTMQAKQKVSELFEASERLALEYFEVVDVRDFKPLRNIQDKNKVVLCIAAEIGNVRLIDNIPLFS